MRIYKENTNDNGYVKTCYASDNMAEYRLTSAYAHDLYTDYVDPDTTANRRRAGITAILILHESNNP